MFQKKTALLAVVSAAIWTSFEHGKFFQLYVEAATPAGTNLTSYPVRFIEGASALGNFLVAMGLVLQDADAYHSFFADKNCTCRLACWTHPPCLASSYEIVDGKVLCRMSNKTTRTTNLAISEGSYVFKTEAVPNNYYGVQADNFLYVIPNETRVQTSAKFVCARIPGHRLAILKTVNQYNALMSLHVKTGYELMVDLMTDATNSPIWGDGVYLRDTPLQGTAVLDASDGVDATWRAVNQLLGDMLPNSKKQFVCQANPLGQNW